jgi:hypothetical protein
LPRLMFIVASVRGTSPRARALTRQVIEGRMRLLEGLR